MFQVEDDLRKLGLIPQNPKNQVQKDLMALGLFDITPQALEEISRTEKMFLDDPVLGPLQKQFDTGEFRAGFSQMDFAPEKGVEAARITRGRARVLGIDTSTGAPTSSRTGFSLSEKGVSGALRSLIQAFPNATAGSLDVKENFDLTAGLGNDPIITFISPDTGQETLFDAFGPDVGDISTVSRDVAVATADVAGTLGGFAVTKNPAASVLTGAASASVVDWVALKLGKLFGYNDLSDEEIKRQAQLTLGASMVGGSIGGNMAIRAKNTFSGGSFSNAAKDTAFVAPNSDVAIRQGIEKFQPAKEIIEDLTGQSFPASAAGVSRLSKQPVFSSALDQQEMQAQSMAGGGQLVQYQQTQQEILARLEKLLFPEIADETQRIVGGKIASKIGRPQLIEKQKAEASSINALKEAEELAEQIPSGSELLQVERIRSLFSDGKYKISRKFSDQYEEIGRRIQKQGIVFDLTPLRESSLPLLDKANHDIYQSLAPEEIKVLTDATGAGTKIVVTPAKPAGAIVNEQGISFIPATPQTTEVFNVPQMFSVVSRALSDLKAEKEFLRTQPDPRRNIRDVDKMIDALQLVRDKTLKSADPQLSQDLIDLDLAYGVSKTEIERGVIGQVISNKGGVFRLKSERVIPVILGDVEKAKNLAKIIANEENFASTGKRIMRDAIFQDYRRNVLNPDTGLVNPTKHNTWVKNNPGTKEFLRKKDLDLLSNAQSSAKFLKAKQQAQDRILASVNKKFGLELTEIDPQAVITRVWNPGLSERGVGTSTTESRIKTNHEIREAVRVLSQDPLLLKQFQEGIQQEIGKEILVKGVIDPQILINVLNLRRKDITDVFRNTDFAKNLKALKDGLIVSGSQGGKAIASEGNVLVQGMRILAAPLTARGRAFTAIKLALSNDAQKEFVDAMFTPRRLAVVMEAFKHNPKSDMFIRLMSSVGLTEIGLAYRDFGDNNE